MKYAKPLALVLGVVIVGAIAAVLVISHIRSKEQRERMEQAAEMFKQAEALNQRALEMQERAERPIQSQP